MGKYTELRDDVEELGHDITGLDMENRILRGRVDELYKLLDHQAELLALLYEKLGYKVTNVPEHKKVVKR